MLHYQRQYYADSVAFIASEDPWKYQRLSDASAHLARSLIGHGIKSGDRVVLQMTNLPEMIVAYHACFRVGAIVAPLHVRLKTAELRAVVQRLRPALYLGEADFYSAAAGIEADILAADARFVVGGPVEDDRALESGSVGRLTSDTQVRLINDEGKTVQRGDTGEMLIRAHGLAAGYWTGPGQIDGLAQDGWFHTGDPMRQGDNDELWFVSRKKELLVRGGDNISPVEVEQVLLQHPLVRDAAVAGVPDATLGQRVVALVHLDGNGDDDIIDDIRASVLAQLASFKVPERLYVVETIPKNSLGKVDRRTVAAVASDMEARER